ncbi:hypothetical protein BRD03_14770 [Halobacteriales archaeon QS_9_68_17]|nr:MAG: hypothetical protein BRD03_14770 [Halobacteriales archaeon QS_9_68_17]
MGTKTIGVRTEVYERLKARKRDDESFTDLVDRMLDETTPDWRDGFGTLSSEESDELERITSEAREATSDGLSKRQVAALEELTALDEEPDETA